MNWNFIETYYPSYSSSDLVLESDILRRFVDGEEVSADDRLRVILPYKNKEGGVEGALKRIERELYERALKGFFQSDDCDFVEQTTCKEYPKTLLIHNTVGGMIWQVYHVNNRNEARFLAMNAKRNGFEWRRLVDYIEDEEETSPDWREASDVWIKIAE